METILEGDGRTCWMERSSGDMVVMMMMVVV
jgi:hypothetical protein